MIRRLLPAILIVVVGCSGKREPASGPDRSEPARRSVSAAMVTDVGGIDDQSFNASTWAGMQRAKAELGVRIQYLESREQSDYVANLSGLAEQGNDLVFAVGYLMEDALKQVAPAHPGVKFAIIDGSAPPLPNCLSIKFREEEGSFLAGYLAGKMTRTGAIGFVGGMEGALIKKFEAGYIAGARTAKPDIRVLIKYVGSWDDVARGKELALAEIDDGADILFHAAGKAGLGVIDAAHQKGEGFYAIGVDKDQDSIRPGRVLTSMLKRVDNAVFETIHEVQEGRWTGGEKVFGIKEGGVGLSPMKHTKEKVPPEVLKQIDRLGVEIAEGRIKVPTTDAELQNFTPPGKSESATGTGR